MANIARKVDRLKIAGDTAASTADENALDTAVDLYVYALKYLTFLADADPTVLADVLPSRDDGIGWSDGPEGVERLLTAADLSTLDTGVDESIQDLVTAVDTTFAQLESSFTTTDRPAPPSARAQLTSRLAVHAIRLVSALRAGHPEIYHNFIDTWQHSL